MIWLFLALFGDGPSQIFFVRHAEKATDQGSNPHLTERGEDRVQRLISFLESVHFDGVYSTPYFRTQETAGPVASHQQTELKTIEVNEFPQLLENLASKSGNYLVAGHSNTIPEWINGLGCQTKAIDESDYSSLFLVIKGENSCQVLRFNFDVCME